MRLAIPAQLAELGRGEARQAFERGREMTLVTVTDPEGDFGQGGVGLGEASLRARSAADERNRQGCNGNAGEKPGRDEWDERSPRSRCSPGRGSMRNCSFSNSRTCLSQRGARDSAEWLP